ncbi:hypothetical protein EON65_13490 [archaeon]|nr:MAG: hypothetical protein EON65_13490 [archaeon]
MRLLLSRILEGSSGISQTERSFLLSLAIGCEISDSLLELDTAHILSKGFMCYLQLRSDRDEITDKETLSLLESEHSLSVLTLNASKWSKIIQYDTLRLPVLPKIFSRLRGEYERFYRSQHPDSRKMRFVWCYGQGCVQLAIYVNEREVGEVTVNEIECATLKLLQHGFQTIRSLAVSLNLDEENMKVIIASLQELHNPNGVVLVEVKNGGIVCLSSKLSHDNLHDASFLRDTSIVRKTTIKELNTGTWRHSVIDAAVMRVVKKHSRHESLPANAALLVSAAVKELHTAYPNTLFQTEEVKRQFCSLVDAGCIAEDILVEDRYALMQTRHRKTPTERSPGSIPLGGHTQNYHACKIYSEKSYSDGREVPALLPYEPTFKEDLLRWIADFSWTIDYNATSLSCYGSRIPLPIHGVAYTPSVPTVGFRHWLDLCARDLWRSSILSMAALLRELNMLVHQLVCKQHNVDYRIYPIPKLATLEDSLRDIHGQYDANMSDIILLQLFLHIFNSRRYFSLFLANICVTAVNSKDKNVLASCCASLNTCTTEFLQVWKGTFELKVSISQIFQQFEESYEGSANTTMANANSSVDLEVAEGKDNYSESEDIKGYCDDNIAEDDDQAEYAYSLYDLIVSVFEAAWDEADTLKSVSYLGRPSSQVDLFPSLLLTNKSLAEGFSEKSSPPTQQIYSTANRHEKKEALDGRKSSKADENDSHRIQSLAFTLQDPGSPDHFIERMHRSPPPLRSVSRFESPWRTETKEVGGENSSVNPHRMQFMMPPSISNELEHMSRRLQDFRSSGSAKAEEMFSIPFPVNELSPRVWETDSSPTIHLNTLLPNYSSFLEPNARSDTNPISGTASKFIDAKLSSEGKSPYKSSNSSAHTNYSLQSLSVIVSGVTRKVIALLAHKPHRTDSVSEELLAGPVDEITKEICNYTLARMSELATRSDSSRLVWWFADAPLTVDSLLESVDKLLHKPVKASKPISALELCQLPSLDELCGKMDCNQVNLFKFVFRLLCSSCRFIFI